MAEIGASVKYFSGGDDVDFREYRRWKQWTINKMNVMDKLPKEARGSFVWTLLQGKALELVEHLKESDYQKEGGDKVLFDILDSRWPEMDRADEMGEHISEIFALRAKEGESLRQWCARARECFDRCARKTGVAFPEEAKGWLLLHCGGLNEEQRAVVLARAQGVLKAETIAQSMRSCFPDLLVPKRRPNAAMPVEHLEDEVFAIAADEVEDRGVGFDDVEQFLADHDMMEAPVESAEEIYEERDVAEVLAVSWKEKRKEIPNSNKLDVSVQLQTPVDPFGWKLRSSRKEQSVTSVIVWGIGHENVDQRWAPILRPPLLAVSHLVQDWWNILCVRLG